MIERLLAELGRGKTLSVERLATRLETTPALVEMMLELLEQQGRVKVVESCMETCAECPLGALCSTTKPCPQRLWQLVLDS